MELKKNDIIQLDITDLGNDGEGIGHYDGLTLFVKDAIPGDVISAKIMKMKKNYGYARLEKVLKASEMRVEPVCSIARSCGGCQLQELDYNAQLLYKQNTVCAALERIGKFSAEELGGKMEGIIGMDSPWNYRNKAQFPIGRNRDGELIAGFYAGRTHSIIKCEDCKLGIAENKKILDVILSHMNKYAVQPYDETSGKGLVRHVLIRKGFNSGELLICLVLNKEKAKAGSKNEKLLIKGQDELIENLVKIEGVCSISINHNTEKSNRIMGPDITLLWGKTGILDTIDCEGKNLTFQISPLSFYQVNPVQMQKLYSKALEYAGLNGNEVVWDLYCGIGTISLFLARRAKEVHGIEIIPQAIEDAKENAKRNGINNAYFTAGAAEKLASTLPPADVIVVDPPRKGCDAVCLETILNAHPERIVYVSCDPATLARDLRILCDGGYVLEKLYTVDMFPQTGHVETVCLLSRKAPV